MGYGFSKQDAARIADTVKRSEAMAIGGGTAGHAHHFRPGNNYSYDGPFAVIQKDDTTVTFCGLNAEEDRLLSAWLNLGLEWVEFDECDVTVTASGYPLIKVTADSEDAYILEAVVLPALPTQTNEEYYYLLPYYITFADGKITAINDMRSIHLPGRLF